MFCSLLERVCNWAVRAPSGSIHSRCEDLATTAICAVIDPTDIFEWNDRCGPHDTKKSSKHSTRRSRSSRKAAS